jgi:predicted membrane protein
VKRWQIIIGLLLIFFGILALIEALFELDLGRFVGPVILIGLGILLILRPRVAGPNVHVQMPIFGDIRKTGAWQATQHEIWSFVGSNLFDFTSAEFPEGEAKIKVVGFVNDITVVLPEDVGLSIKSHAFIAEFKDQEGKQERFISAFEYQSPNFSAAEKRVQLHAVSFVAEMRVKTVIF